MTDTRTINAPQLSTFEQQKEATAKQKVHVWPMLFVFVMAMPFVINLGTLHLTPYRLFLFAMFFPAVIGWMFSKAGAKRTADYYIIAYTIWVQIAIVGADGFDVSIEPIGIAAIESMGAYFLGRTFIRSQYQFRSFIKTFLFVLVCLLPLAIAEALTRRTIALDLMGKILKTLPGAQLDNPGRLGMRRAQVTFEHPILYGLYATYGFSLATYGLERGLVSVKSGFRGVLAAFCVFFSLSTGAFLVVATQILLSGWEIFTRTVKSRWKIIISGFVIVFVTIDVLSDRTPFQVFISYLTFDQSTSYYRVLIFRYGMEQIWRTPVFGIGFTGDWERPFYMQASMDNYWLLLAVRHGIMAFVLFLVAVIYILRDIGRAQLHTQELKNIRYAWMFCIISMFVGICTVHLWGATYVLFMFMLGAGMWLADAHDQESATDLVSETATSTETVKTKKGNFRPAAKPGVRPEGSRPATRQVYPAS